VSWDAIFGLLGKLIDARAEVDAARAKEESRRAQIIRAARWTLAVAVVAAFAGIVAAWPVVQGWWFG
jgi:hypothetical protein